jgi:hypothetical protein
MRFGGQDDGILRFGGQDDGILRFGAQDYGTMRMAPDIENVCYGWELTCVVHF